MSAVGNRPSDQKANPIGSSLLQFNGRASACDHIIFPQEDSGCASWRVLLKESEEQSIGKVVAIASFSIRARQACRLPRCN